MNVRSRVGVPFGLSLLVAGCMQVPGATPVIGPDGTSLFHVHCGDEQVACFELAGQRCPSGYELSPIFDPRDGNFLVRCHPYEAVAVTPAPSAPPDLPQNRLSSNTKTADDWPPVEAGTPMEPWPAPAVSSRVPPEIGY